jgi:hypothetical protein
MGAGGGSEKKQKIPVTLDFSGTVLGGTEGGGVLEIRRSLVGCLLNCFSVALVRPVHHTCHHCHTPSGEVAVASARQRYLVLLLGW